MADSNTVCPLAGGTCIKATCVFWNHNHASDSDKPVEMCALVLAARKYARG